MNTPYRLTPHIGRKLKREKSNLSDEGSDCLKEPVRVVCRLRPLKDDDDESCITLISPTVLSLNAPADPKYEQKKLNCKFKQIFSSYATQKEIFEYVAMPLLQDLLKGKNALLLSYGVTGSGKTYTLSGEPSNPGIIPRSIDTLFNTIGELQAPKFTVKPDKMNSFLIQSEDEAVQDRLLENKINCKTFSGKNNRRVKGDQPQYVNEGTRISDIDESCSYAVFVSYIEIYNNSVFDLLEESNTKSLQGKILREDAQKNMYVMGATEVEVKSADEAFEVLVIGQTKKKMGDTLLNSQSSRSHSVFNIRLVQIEQVSKNSNGIAVVPDCNLMKVSQLSLVDLAGSERNNRTQTTGLRLKEAGRINNSLMSLRNCMEVLRENQLSGSNKLVPYRDSRLTYLFKSYFEGYGKVAMIVCVNPSVVDYEENIQVMKYAEMSQDVKIKSNERKATPYIQKAQKRIFNTPTSNVKMNSVFSLPKIPTFNFDPDNFDEMGDKIEQIGKILKLRSTKMESYFSKFNNEEKHFRNRLCELHKGNILNTSEIKSMKAIIKKERQESCDKNKKIADLETINHTLTSKNSELHEVIQSLKQTIDEKDLRINQKILEKEKVKQKSALAKETMSQELEIKLRKQRQHLQASMDAKEEKLKRVQEILDGDEREVHTEEACEMEGTEPETPPPELHQISPPLSPEVPSSSKKIVQTYVGRHRRSRSAGEVWLEHNSIKPVPLGTVLQPSVKKRKSLKKLTKASDITNPKQSKYCLIAQDQDTEGEIETKVYKADIVPTCGGGAQVIFNDVELLKQKSPTATP